jgi:hypothetical protein
VAIAGAEAIGMGCGVADSRETLFRLAQHVDAARHQRADKDEKDQGGHDFHFINPVAD